MSNDIQMQFAQRLQLLRKAQGMTQHTVAAILNVSRPAYAYYESGKSAPSLESMRRLVRLFCPDAPRYLLLLDEPTKSADLLCERSSGDGEPPLFSSLTAREQTALGMFRVMDEEQKEQAMLLLSRLLNGEEEK